MIICALVTLLYSRKLQAASIVFNINCVAVCVMLASKSKISDPLGLPPLPRRSPSIYSKARSRVWFEIIVMNRNMFDDASYKYYFRMNRDTVAYIVQSVYHDLQRTDPNFKQALSMEHIAYICLWNFTSCGFCWLRPCPRCSRSVHVYSLKNPAIPCC